MTTLIAFHGQQSIKDEYLSRVRKHREADELVQAYGYWANGKGCAVGCTLHIDGDGDPHERYEDMLGIPVRLAYLEDTIFEGLPVDAAKMWPERFLSAISPGADLSRVWHQFAAWLLSDSRLLTITDINREAISAIVRLHTQAAEGNQPSSYEWSASAASASASAWSAWWSAADSARSAACIAMSDRLIELMTAAN